MRRLGEMLFLSPHSDRPGGDSTGGMASLLAGQEALHGRVSPMILLAWRSWKLRRKAIGSNDAEVQAVLEAEDHNFRVRLLWCELHGAGWSRTPQDDQVSWAENLVKDVRGVLCADSKGGYDACSNKREPTAWVEQLLSSSSGHATS